MLDRVALHQTRFRTPGVAPDARGVLLGQRGLFLFPTLDRLVAFLRAYGEDASLDELVPGLSLKRIVTPLRARELALSVHAESSYRMDRLAAVARVVGGDALTGTARHFVAYRDAQAPLGYDVTTLPPEDAELVLHRVESTQAYRIEATMDLRALLLRLAPQAEPRRERGPRAEAPLLLTAEPGLAAAVVGYLARSSIDARVGLVEDAKPSAFAPRRGPLHLFDIPAAPSRLVDLVDDLPGVTAFRPVAAGAAVELGHAHPIPLESIASLFDDGGLTLFRGRGDATHLAEKPTLVDVRGLLLVAELREDPTGSAPQPRALPPAPLEHALPLRLAPTANVSRRVSAVVVPRARRAWLARLIYALPTAALDRLQVAVGDEHVYLVDPEGIEGVPLGRSYAEAAPRIHVPIGLALVPALAEGVLAELVPDHRRGHVFFEPGDAPARLVPLEAFGTVHQVAMRQLLADAVEIDEAVEPDPPLTVVEYERARSFPLWGAQGSHAPSSTDGEEGA